MGWKNKGIVIRPVVIKTGTEKPNPITGLEYPIPDCLNGLLKVADVIVLEGRDSIICSSDPRLKNQSGCIYPIVAKAGGLQSQGA